MSVAVRVQDHGHVRLVTLARPEARNAMNGALLAELLSAVAGRRAATRALVLTGEGGHFCSGGDRREGLAVNGSDRKGLETIQSITRALLDPDLVSFAAVEGWAIGGGAELALACDIVIAASNSRFQFPEASLGVHATGGSTWLLPRAVGWQRAALLTLVGATVDGETAASWGLATEAVPEGAAEARALQLAELVGTSPPDGTAAAKRSMLAAMHGTLEEALRREVDETEPRLHGERSTF